MAEAYKDHGARPEPDEKLLREGRRARTYRDRVAEYKRQLDENPNDPRHGTKAGYSYGCRCERCRAAKRAEGQYVPRSMQHRISKKYDVSPRYAPRIAWLIAHGIPKAKIADFLEVDVDCVNSTLEKAGFGGLCGTENGRSGQRSTKYPDLIG